MNVAAVGFLVRRKVYYENADLKLGFLLALRFHSLK